MGGYDGWSGGIALVGTEVMIWGWLRWGEVIFGGDCIHICMLLRCFGEDYNTIHVANDGGGVYNVCGFLDHGD